MSAIDFVGSPGSQPPSGVVEVSTAAELQAAINAIPAGNRIDIRAIASFTATSTITCGTKRFHLSGVGKPNYNDTTSGVVISTGTLGMTLFSIAASGTQNQSGPTFENISFYDAATGSTLFDVVNTNRCTWKDCHLGAALRTNGTTGISMTFDSSLDCSWHYIENCQFTRLAVGIEQIKGFGAICIGCTIVGCTIGIDIYPPVNHWRIIGLKGDACNPCIHVMGSANSISNFHWETTDSGTTAYQGILIEGDGVTQNSGSRNIVMGAFVAASSGANTKGVELASTANYCAVLGINAQGFVSSQGVISASPTSRVDRLLADDFGAWISLGVARIFTGTGTPESVVTADIGSLYLRTDGSTSTTLYVKTSGTGSTGWTAK